MPQYQSYIICTSPRSGSTLLCGLLAATGKAGNPDSHFHTPSFARWLQVYGLHATDYATGREALRAIFKAAHIEGSGGTGIFGLRVQQHSFGFLGEQLRALHPGLPSDQARIQAAFGRTLYIHLTRIDKLAQAISYVTAKQSGLWHAAPDGTEVERLSPPAEPVYNADEIATALTDLTTQEDAWMRWFADEGITPLRISYDALSANPTDTLAAVLGALGLDEALASGICPTVAKLANEASQDWAKRFRAERLNA